MAPEMIVPPKQTAMNQQLDFQLLQAMKEVGIYPPASTDVTTLLASDVYSFAILAWETTVAPLTATLEEEGKYI
jgi:hypothetical protein